MNPDSWIPFYGGDFFQAVEGFDEIKVTAYLRALWHYWHHFHCSGLPQDDEYLKRLCRCDSASWSRTRGSLFGDPKFFVLEDGRWHQKRAKEEYVKALSLCKKLTDASKKGVERRRELGQIKTPLVGPTVEPEDRPVVEPLECMVALTDELSKRTTQLQPQPQLKTEAVPTAPADAVAEPVPKPKERTPAQAIASARFRWCEGVMTLWKARYKSDHGGTEYQVTVGDKGHLADLSKTETVKASDFVGLAARAWKHRTRANFSHCKNSHSISYVCRYYNQIVEELKNENNPSNSGGGNEGTLNQGKHGPDQYKNLGRMVQT